MDIDHRQEAGRKSEGPSTQLAAVILAAAAIIFAFEQRSIGAVNGWWLDELFSLTVTDPSQAFVQAYRNISDDASPPLYYLALYAVRALFHPPIERERMVVLVLNLCAILAMSLVVIWASRRAGMTGLALVGIAAFLLSGPVLEYAPEARAYLLSMAIVFAASWFTALAIEDPDHGRRYGWFIALGMLAALTHFFAALMCGCLGAGLIVVGMLKDRRGLDGRGLRNLRVSGFALGLSAMCTYAFWFFALADRDVLGRISWVKFDLASIQNTALEIRQLMVGGEAALAIACLLLVFGLVYRATRLLTAAFLIAFTLFLSLPLLISIKTPIITGYHLLAGAPMFVVFLIFLAQITIADVRRGMQRMGPLGRLLMGLTAIALLVASSVTGFASAGVNTKNKMIWEGADIVNPLIRNCPAGSIHVFKYRPEHAELSHVPEEVFLDADKPATSWLTLADGSCPVLGWAEHLDYTFAAGASDAELLRMLKIDALPSTVEIRRHPHGYVVLRRNP